MGNIAEMYGAVLHKLLFPFHDGGCGELQVLDLIVTLVAGVCKK